MWSPRVFSFIGQRQDRFVFDQSIHVRHSGVEKDGWLSHPSPVRPVPPPSGCEFKEAVKYAVVLRSRNMTEHLQGLHCQFARVELSE